MPTLADIKPTKALTDAEQEAWLIWYEVLKATRSFLATDPPLVTSLAEYTVRKQRAMSTAEDEGHYVEGRRHPALTDLDNVNRDIMATLRELGLTPASFKNVKGSSRQSKGRVSIEDFNRSFEGN